MKIFFIAVSTPQTALFLRLNRVNNGSLGVWLALNGAQQGSSGVQLGLMRQAVLEADHQGSLGLIGTH